MTPSEIRILETIAARPGQPLPHATLTRLTRTAPSYTPQAVKSLVTYGLLLDCDCGGWSMVDEHTEQWLPHDHVFVTGPAADIVARVWAAICEGRQRAVARVSLDRPSRLVYYRPAQRSEVRLVATSSG